MRVGRRRWRRREGGREGGKERRRKRGVTGEGEIDTSREEKSKKMG